MNISDFSLHNPWIGAIIIVVIVVLSVVIQLISNKWFSNDHFDNMQNVSGIYMSAVGTLYSVVLGLLLVDASDDFSNAKRYLISKKSQEWAPGSPYEPEGLHDDRT